MDYDPIVYIDIQKYHIIYDAMQRWIACPRSTTNPALRLQAREEEIEVWDMMTTNYWGRDWEFVFGLFVRKSFSVPVRGDFANLIAYTLTKMTTLPIRHNNVNKHRDVGLVRLCHSIMKLGPDRIVVTEEEEKVLRSVLIEINPDYRETENFITLFYEKCLFA